MRTRCSWAEQSINETQYHDTEWGVPLYNDQKLFEFIVLEGAQAGLSWSTILNKRQGYRNAFENFNIKKVANFSEQQLEELRNNPEIIRNKLKIKSAVTNAQAVLQIINEFGSLHKYLWSFVNGETIVNQWSTMKEVPATSPESDAMSKALKKRGFKFMGSTICYAFMQATGMVNDHTTDCFRYQQCIALKSKK